MRAKAGSAARNPRKAAMPVRTRAGHSSSQTIAAPICSMSSVTTAS
jgi:hypothetical protein